MIYLTIFLLLSAMGFLLLLFVLFLLLFWLSNINILCTFLQLCHFTSLILLVNHYHIVFIVYPKICIRKQLKIQISLTTWISYNFLLSLYLLFYYPLSALKIYFFSLVYWAVKHTESEPMLATIY